MWLPTPVYERVPQYWFLLGIGFFAFGLYLGLDYEYVLGYFAVGAGCIVASIWVTLVRRRNRIARAQRSSADDAMSSDAAADGNTAENPN